MPWSFRCFLSARRRDVVDDWYRGLDDRAQAAFDTRMRFLKQQPITGWKRPHFDKFAGRYRGLGKVRFQSGNVQYRPIGFFSGGQEFTFVFPEATERGGRWAPRNARDIARDRMEIARNDRRRTHGCEFE